MRRPSGSCSSRTTIISASRTAPCTRARTTTPARWHCSSHSPIRWAAAGLGSAATSSSCFRTPRSRRTSGRTHGLREHVGQPFVFLSTGRTETYHTGRDTPDTLDYAKLARVTTWVGVLAMHAADADGSLEWRDFTADPRADARSLLRMSASVESSARFPWPLRRALAADRRAVEALLRRWEAGEAPTHESYRALQLASTRLQAAQWRPSGWYFALW